MAPGLGRRAVGGLAFFVVCGLIGAALGLFGVHVYLIVEQLSLPGAGGVGHGVAVAAGIRDIVFEVGSLLGFAGILYLLAPPPETYNEPGVEPTA